MLDEFLNSQPSGPLYHYTSCDALKSILESGYIWMTHIRHLNDFTEFNEAIEIAETIAIEAQSNAGGDRAEYLKAIPKNLAVLRRDQDQLPYVTSFCDDRDALSLWRGYSPREGPINFGYDWSKNESKSIILTKCWYDNDIKHTIIEQMIDKHFNEDPKNIRDKVAEYHATIDADATDGDVKAIWFSWMLSLYAPGFKHTAFKDEREWRVVMLPPRGGFKPNFRCGKAGPIPYVTNKMYENGDFNVHEIVVGPASDARTTIEAFRRFISCHNSQGNKMPTINCKLFSESSIPLRFL